LQEGRTLGRQAVPDDRPSEKAASFVAEDGTFELPLAEHTASDTFLAEPLAGPWALVRSTQAESLAHT
jgi:hypothetical protein